MTIKKITKKRWIVLDVPTQKRYMYLINKGDTEMDANTIAAKIAALPFVEKATAWTKVAGKERIYIDLKRYDKRGNVFGGVGGSCFVDVNSGKLMYGNTGYNDSPFCNSYTLAFHRENDTFAKIKEAAGIR